jgi:long-chain acyl-CoA synthetase
MEDIMPEETSKFTTPITERVPWATASENSYIPLHLDYFDSSMFEAVENTAKKYPNQIAFDFMGRSTTYRKMIEQIEKCAKALRTIGVRENDCVTIAMPNCPQAI